MHVFPAYQQITGIHLQDWCSTVQYVIYDKDKWSKSGAPGGAGGYTVGCRTQYMADYSLLLKSEIGPYDVHEILHDYQIALGALPYTHILFAPSMVEATRLIGDSERICSPDERHSAGYGPHPGPTELAGCCSRYRMS